MDVESQVGRTARRFDVRADIPSSLESRSARAMGTFYSIIIFFCADVGLCRALQLSELCICRLAPGWGMIVIGRSRVSAEVAGRRSPPPFVEHSSAQSELFHRGSLASWFMIRLNDGFLSEALSYRMIARAQVEKPAASAPCSIRESEPGVG